MCKHLVDPLYASISFCPPHFSCWYSSLSIVTVSYIFYSIASNVVSDNKNNAHFLYKCEYSLTLTLTLFFTYKHTPCLSFSLSLFSSRFDSCGFAHLFVRSFVRSLVHSVLSFNTRFAITYAQIITSSQVLLFYFA